MIEAITYFPDLHRVPEVQRGLATKLTESFNSGNIDMIFMEGFPAGFEREPVHGLRFVGVEHMPYWRRHRGILRDIAHLEIAGQSGLDYDVKLYDELVAEFYKYSLKRSRALVQNVLVISADLGFRKPGLVCGVAHSMELGLAFLRRGYEMGVVTDYMPQNVKTTENHLEWLLKEEALTEAEEIFRSMTPAYRNFRF